MTYHHLYINSSFCYYRRFPNIHNVNVHTLKQSKRILNSLMIYCLYLCVGGLLIYPLLILLEILKHYIVSWHTIYGYFWNICMKRHKEMFQKLPFSFRLSFISQLTTRNLFFLTRNIIGLPNFPLHILFSSKTSNFLVSSIFSQPTDLNMFKKKMSALWF